MKRHCYSLFAAFFIVLITFFVVGPAQAVNNCLDFDGADNYVQANSTYSIGANASFTIEAWVNIDVQEEVNFATVYNQKFPQGLVTI